jgi:hypothetical protein
MVSGVVVYLPLGVLTLMRASCQQPSARFARGVVAGILIQAAVVVAALISTR